MERYGGIKRAVLELVNQYSIAGETVSPAYNNQSDYLRRIPNLVNQALSEIRTAYRPRRAVWSLPPEEGEPIGSGVWKVWTLPGDCRQLISGGIRAADGDGPRSIPAYRLLGDRKLALPAGRREYDGAAFLAEYEPYPEQLPEDPDDTWELDEEPEVVQAACYFAAAGLVLPEDEFSYAALRNEYESRLARLRPHVTAEMGQVLDVMNWEGAGL